MSESTARDPASGAAESPRRYVIRPYRTGDFDRIRALYRACFSIELDGPDWAWKFDAALTDPQPAFHVAACGADLVGVYPTRSLRVQVGDTVRVLTQAQDVCVHPQHRGGAVLKGLFKANEATERGAGVPFLFGFPTADHMKVGIRIFKYIDMFHLIVWFRPLTRGIGLQARLPAAALRAPAYALGARLQALRTPRLAFAGGDTVRIADMASFNHAADDLWELVRSRYCFAVVRDAAHLNWRYVARPGGRFRILGAWHGDRLAGYCVYRDNMVRPDCWRVGALMDLLAVEPAVARELAQVALDRMRAARCGYAVALAHPDSQVAPVLREAGFEPDPGMGEVHVATRCYADGLDLTTYQRPAEWLLNYGDTDHLG